MRIAPAAWILVGSATMSHGFVHPTPSGFIANTPKQPASSSSMPDIFALRQNQRSIHFAVRDGLTSADEGSGAERPRKRDRFQRDILRKVGFSSPNRKRSYRNGGFVSSDAPAAGQLQLQSRSKSTLLQAKKDDGTENEQTKSKPSRLAEWKDSVVASIMERIPQPVIDFLSNLFIRFTNFFPSLKIMVLSFGCGVVFAFSAIFVPIYTSLESLSQPVALFETILADLETGYVDPVDTNRLFETGISAMLRSLDPYTEFETKEDAQQLTEGIQGRYGGVGLVISGATPNDLTKYKDKYGDPKLAQQQRQADQEEKEQDGVPIAQDMPSTGDATNGNDDSAADDFTTISADSLGDDSKSTTNKLDAEEDKRIRRTVQKGIRVVSAFEGYAFDYGMRVGDRLVSIDGTPIVTGTSVEDVRNLLRGEPNTMVSIKFEREGVKGVQEVTMPRTIVRLRDVKLATLVGKPSDGIGYIRLSGFAANAGAEVRQAIFALEGAVADATNGELPLQSLILDLRGNPGGLLTSAVDVSSLLVPKGSEIVSAKGRGFPGLLYKSRADPILDPRTKLAVLVNGGTASAAEIVSGAVQDLDAGIIVGSDRTFGKGLVQNVEELPFDTALKFTVAKYYTPSGRCIQGVTYTEGGGLKSEDNGKYKAKKVEDKDRQVFYTTAGRAVRDGGGIEADYKVEAPKASALEVTLLGSDAFSEFASQWSRQNELTQNFEVDDRMYDEFQRFVASKQQKGEIKLEALYSGPLDKLKTILEQSEYKSSEREVERLQRYIVEEIQRDFGKYSKDIKEDIANSILARYLPESMLLERDLKTDQQVQETVKLLKTDNGFEKVLAKGNQRDQDAPLAQSPGETQLASSKQNADESTNGAKVTMQF